MCVWGGGGLMCVCVCGVVVVVCVGGWVGEGGGHTLDFGCRLSVKHM